MTAAIRAGLFYFIAVFATGFILGSIRVTLIVPRLGELAAVGLETPVILGISWWVCRRLVARQAVPPGTVPRLAMGGTAFALLMLAELALAVIAFGRTPAEHWATYAALPAQLGLAAQIGFALMPLVHHPARAAVPPDGRRR